MTSVTMPTAWRNTSRPSMRRWPTVLGGRGAAVDIELVAVAAVGAQLRGDEHAATRPAVARARLQHDRPGAVAEQDAGRAVLPVEDAREGLGADHQRALVRAGGQELVGGRHGEDEAGADRLKVEGGAVVMPSAAWIWVGDRRESVGRASRWRR